MYFMGAVVYRNCFLGKPKEVPYEKEWGGGRGRGRGRGTIVTG
jgi:hypothetical protein